MDYIVECKERMDRVIKHYHLEMNQVRTGRANASILDGINLDYYGVPTPINQIASITVVEGTQLVIKPFDISFLKEIEKEINSSNLGFNANNDSNVIRIMIPGLTEEKRKEIVKGLSKVNEDAKIMIRNIRRDINEMIKKSDELTEDEEKKTLENIQKLTDEFSKEIDKITEIKSQEILAI